jgi:hypothetical protein
MWPKSKIERKKPMDIAYFQAVLLIQEAYEGADPPQLSPVFKDWAKLVQWVENRRKVVSKQCSDAAGEVYYDFTYHAHVGEEVVEIRDWDMDKNPANHILYKVEDNSETVLILIGFNKSNPVDKLKEWFGPEVKYTLI